MALLSIARPAKPSPAAAPPHEVGAAFGEVRRRPNVGVEEAAEEAFVVAAEPGRDVGHEPAGALAAEEEIGALVLRHDLERKPFFREGGHSLVEAFRQADAADARPVGPRQALRQPLEEEGGHLPAAATGRVAGLEGGPRLDEAGGEAHVVVG